MFDFHNHVNKSKKKAIMDKVVLHNYSSANVQESYVTFLQVYAPPTKTKLLETFDAWFQANKDLFVV